MFSLRIFGGKYCLGQNTAEQSLLSDAFLDKLELLLPDAHKRVNVGQGRSNRGKMSLNGTPAKNIS